MSLKLHTIIASTRPGRVGLHVAKWFHEYAVGHGGFDTTLGLHGPDGTASVTLVSQTPIAVADLLNDNALVLPPH